MTIRFASAISLIAFVSACSSQPGPSGVSATEQGYNAFRVGNFSAAEKAYDSALAADPTDVTAMLGLAEVYEKAGRTSEAVKLYSRVQAQNSGTIRVWNDGYVKQQGVTELASRRLAALGHSQVRTASFAGPVVQELPPVGVPQPIATAETEPQSTQYWPENPTYVLDENGLVNYVDVAAAPVPTTPVFEVPRAVGTTYFADPEGTQPITLPVFETPEVATLSTPAPAYETVATTPIEAAVPAVARSQEALPTVYETAPTLAISPYETAPLATRYESAPSTPPLRQALITPMVNEVISAPMPSAPIVAPIPTAARPATPSLPAQPLTRTQPGYAVIDGNFVYISAEDIANGSVSNATSETISLDDLNGIEIPNLN